MRCMRRRTSSADTQPPAFGAINSHLYGRQVKYQMLELTIAFVLHAHRHIARTGQTSHPRSLQMTYITSCADHCFDSSTPYILLAYPGIILILNLLKHEAPTIRHLVPRKRLPFSLVGYLRCDRDFTAEIRPRTSVLLASYHVEHSGLSALNRFQIRSRIRHFVVYWTMDLHLVFARPQVCVPLQYP